ncbi:class I SAM-dependent methyltransferase [Pirellulaceae bacterium SH449]
MAERQMVVTLDEVREDHLKRYQFALETLVSLNKLGTVIDAGCGVGYGSSILASRVEKVWSLEISEEAFGVYRENWERPNINFRCGDLLTFEPECKADAVICFEFIEHIEFYDLAIQKFSRWSDFLVISTPNESVRPHLQEPVNPFHFRHFTPEELEQSLNKHGFQVESWHCQKNGAKPDLLPGTQGKFIIAVASK